MIFLSKIYKKKKQVKYKQRFFSKPLKIKMILNFEKKNIRALYGSKVALVLLMYLYRRFFYINW